MEFFDFAKKYWFMIIMICFIYFRYLNLSYKLKNINKKPKKESLK